MKEQSNATAGNGESADVLLTVRASRKRVAPCLAVSVLCLAATCWVFFSSKPSFVVFWFVAAGFSTLMLALHDATMKHTVIVHDDALIFRRTNILSTKQDRFEEVEDISLAKPEGGEGAVPVAISKVQQEYASFHTHPRVNGLCISSGGRMRHIPLKLPFEELLSLAATLTEYAKAHGILLDTPKTKT